MELPANMLTPTTFCERIRKEAEGIEGLEVVVRDEGDLLLVYARINADDRYSCSVG